MQRMTMNTRSSMGLYDTKMLLIVQIVVGIVLYNATRTNDMLYMC